MAGSDVKSVHLTADTTAADADGVCETQTPAAGGSQDLSIDGAQEVGSTGVAAFNAGRLITIASAADDSARTFTVTGTDVNGDAQTETIAGPATTVTGTKYFKTVTVVNVDANTAGAITVGMSAEAADVIFRERARLKGAFIVNAATAGIVTFLSGSPTGTVKLKLGTVGSVTAERDISIPGEGVVFEDGAYVAYTGGTNEVFTNMTLFHA